MTSRYWNYFSESYGLLQIDTLESKTYRYPHCYLLLCIKKVSHSNISLSTRQLMCMVDKETFFQHVSPNEAFFDNR